MRLVYPDPHPVPDYGTESLQILYTVDALGDIGIDITVLTPPLASDATAIKILGRPLSPRVTLTPVTKRRRWLPVKSNRPFYRAAASELRKARADAVLV